MFLIERDCVFTEGDFYLTMRTTSVDSEMLRSIEPSISVEDFEVDGLDLAGNKVYASFLTYLDMPEYITTAVSNPHVSVILCTTRIYENLQGKTDKVLIHVDDPRWTYFTLHNMIAKQRVYAPSEIHPSASVHPSAVVANSGVVVHANVVIEAGAVIHSSVQIHEGAVIRSNAVLGSPGFEHKRTSKGILSVAHDGDTVIGARAEVGTSSNIAQGYARRYTILGEDCRLDGQVFIAHGVQTGNRVFFAAGAVIAGMCTVGNDVWFGPGTIVRDQIRIGDNAKISIGSVVVRDVRAGNTVFGSPAKVLPSSK